MRLSKFTTTTLASVLCISVSAAMADDATAPPSTGDLAFLSGAWSVERVYQPGTDKERVAVGDLTCKEALSDQYIKCVYFFERAGQAPIHDDVYFNYNPIYGVYESLWLSATWPIKVLMAAPPGADPQKLNWTAEFLIEDGVTEWVRSEWTLKGDGAFSRRTEIRTSRQPEGEWIHWMDETAARIE